MGVCEEALDRSIAHFKAGARSLALKCLDEALSRPLAHRDRVALYHALRGAGRLAEVVRIVHSLIKLNPRDFMAQLCLGRLHHLQGNSGAARSAYKRAARLNPGSQAVAAAYETVGLGEEQRRREEKILEKESAECALIKKMSVFIRAGKLKEAFEVAEKLLDLKPSTEALENLMTPAHMNGERLPAPRLYDLLESLKTRPGRRAYAHWHTLLRVNILDDLRRGEEAFLESRRLTALPRRYAWMRFPRAAMLLRLRYSYAEAEKEFRAVARSTPGFWKSRGCLAEALLCRGKVPEAFQVMDKLVSRLQGNEQAQARCWRGEMRLWRGQYREALADLDGVVDRGARLARCWRGAAQLQLGDIPRAMEDLNVSLERDPEDHEALVWRGEAQRRAGLWRQAHSDLDAALRLENHSFWALINRALVRAALEDLSGFWSDFDLIPRDITDYFEWKLSKPAGRDPIKARALLEDILKAGQGVRRGDGYLYPVWMKRS